MKYLRATLRLLLMGTTLVVLYPVYFIGHLLLIRKPRLAYRFRCRIISLFADCWCRIIGMRITQKGVPPEPPFIMVSNHLGYLDIILLLRVVPAWFVSKSDVRAWPVIGFMARTSHVLFINRGRKRDVHRINQRMGEVLARGESVLFFPEGTSTRGHSVQPLKTSLLAVATQTQTPVHASVVGYRCEPGDPHPSEVLCWWGEDEFAPHLLNLLTLRRFHATVTFLPEPVSHSDRKILADELRQRMEEAFEPNR